MRVLILGVILTVTSWSSYAKSDDPANCSTCKRELSGQAVKANELSDFVAVFSAAKRARIKDIAQRICVAYLLPGIKDRPKYITELITKFMDSDEGIKGATPGQIVDFLNKYRNELICSRRGKDIHYLKATFGAGFQHILFEDYFMETLIPKANGKKINVNAVTFSGPNNTPQTVLDYIDEIIKTDEYGPALSEQLKDFILDLQEELNAKRFSELPKEERLAIMESHKRGLELAGR